MTSKKTPAPNDACPCGSGKNTRNAVERNKIINYIS